MALFFREKNRLGVIHFYIICLCLGFPLPIGKDDTIKKEPSLECSYTSFNSSYYEVVGRLDEEVVDFYSSVTKFHIPKKEWNEELRTFSNKEWKDSILDRIDIDVDWFPRFANVIGERMTSSGDGDATVQMRLGCSSQGGSEPRSFAELAYRGESLLSYRLKPAAPWVLSPDRAGSDRAGPESVQQDFNNVDESWQKHANDRIAEFLNKTCLNLDRFSKYEKVNKSGVPRMYKLNRTGLEPGWRNLSCLVTGFYPRSTKISMRWFKNGVLLVKGIWSTGVRPNGNHTYQIQTGLVTDSDDADYRCEVDYPEIKTWIAEWIPEPRNRLVAVLIFLAILAILLITGVIRVYCVRKRVPAVMVQEDPSPNDILLKDTSDTGSDNTGRDEAYGSGDSCDVSTEELALLSRPRAEQQTGPPDTSCPRAEQQTGPPDNSCPRAEQQTGPPDTSLSPDTSLQTPAQ